MKALALLVLAGGTAAATPCPISTPHARMLTPYAAQLPVGAALHSWSRSLAVFAKPAPPGALAVVVFAADGTTAKSWGVYDAQSHESLVWTSGGCGNPSPGSAAVTGEKVRLAWIDAGGRLGASSPIVTVHLDKTP